MLCLVIWSSEMNVVKDNVVVCHEVHCDSLECDV